MPDSRIPVSSKRGGVWRSRRDTAQKAMKDLIDAWDEAIRYYNHDQSDHRDGTDRKMLLATAMWLVGSMSGSAALRTSCSPMSMRSFLSCMPRTQSSVSPVSHSNDPTMDEAGDAFARAVEKLVNALFRMKYTPGVNIKPKAKTQRDHRTADEQSMVRGWIHATRTRAVNRRCMICRRLVDSSWLKQRMTRRSGRSKAS